MNNKVNLTVTDTSKLLQIITQYPLATVISCLEGAVEISHLPIVAEVLSDNRLKLSGHLSTRNPQWSHLKRGASITLIFNGPNAYVNSSWYTVNDAATWNYVTVQAAGVPELEESYEGLVDILKSTTNLVNHLYEDQWEFYIPEDLQSEADLTSVIGGFTLEPLKLSGRFKLSQSKSLADQKRIIQGLSQRPDQGSHQIASFMSDNLDA